MKSINVTFLKFNEISLPLVLSNYGVYVIWDSQAKKKVTYIGYSHNIAARIKNHSWLSSPINGYAAFFETEEEAKCLEALLIDTGKDLDRLSEYNEKGGHATNMDTLYNKYGVIKFYIRGHNPFNHPKNSSFKDKIIHRIQINANDYTDTFRQRKRAG